MLSLYFLPMIQTAQELLALLKAGSYQQPLQVTSLAKRYWLLVELNLSRKCVPTYSIGSGLEGRVVDYP